MWGQDRAHSLGFSVSQNLFSRSHGSVSRGILYHPGGSRLAPGFLGAEALPCSSFLYLLLQAIPAPPTPHVSCWSKVTYFHTHFGNSVGTHKNRF